MNHFERFTILNHKKYWFHYHFLFFPHSHSLFEFDSIEFFEDETLVTVAYRIYLCLLNQEPNLKWFHFYLGELELVWSLQ